MRISIITFLFLLAASKGTAFVGPAPRVGWIGSRKALLLSTDTDAVNAKLEDVAHKLKLQIYDTTTGVYGFESKQKEFGIETLRADIHISPSLGLELTELAHSDDDRGLVLVSDVSGHAAEESKIQVGDTIIGVFSEPDFKETTTAYAYEDTMDILARAKQHALDHGNDKISLELNRLVSRSTVKVIVEDGKETQEIEALAGDNLRLLLMHHHMKLYDENTHRLDQPNLCSDCGGEGICGTCLVAVREGMDTLNKPPPQEESIMRGRPRTWRAACKTVVGAHNEPGATVRIHLRPQTSEAEDLHLHP